MNIKFRRFLYIFFILLFLALIPVVLTYARGYRFDFSRTRLVKTGGLAVDSFPKNANVYLDGEQAEPSFFEKQLSGFKNILGMRKMGGTTPTIFQNLIPDEYEITVEKDGYHTWSKKLEIYSEQVAFAENISLFLQNPEITPLVQDEILDYKISYDNKKIAYITLVNKQYQVKTLDLDKQETSLLYNSSSPIEMLDWSFSNNKLLISTSPYPLLSKEEAQATSQQAEYIILELNKPEQIITLSQFDFIDRSTKITNLQKKKTILQNTKWDLIDANILYNLAGNTLYQINLANKKVESINYFQAPARSQIVDFLVKDKQVYCIISDQQTSWVKQVKLNSQDEAVNIAELPLSLNYAFSNPQNKYLNIVDTKNQAIRIVNPQAKEIGKSILTKFFANETAWANQGQFLYWDDFELGIFNLYPQSQTSLYKKEVLSRYSQVITKALWYADNNYLIFNLDNAIYAFELDSRDKRNITKLLETDGIKDIFSTGEKRFVYLVGTVNNQEGIYKIKVQ